MATALVVVHGLSEGRVLGTAHGQAALTATSGGGTGRLRLLDTLVPAAGLAATKQGRQPFLQPQHFKYQKICNFFKTTTTTNPDSPLKTPPSGSSSLRLSIAWKTKNVVEISKQPSYCDPFQLTGLVCCFCWSPRLVTCFGSSQPRRRRTHGGRGRPLGAPVEQEEEEVHV